MGMLLSSCFLYDLHESCRIRLPKGFSPKGKPNLKLRSHSETLGLMLVAIDEMDVDCRAQIGP